MCGFYCITFIEYMLARMTLLDYTNLVSPNDYLKNDKIICNYSKDQYGRRSKSTITHKICETNSSFHVE